jgi:hypothetical protein
MLKPCCASKIHTPAPMQTYSQAHLNVNWNQSLISFTFARIQVATNCVLVHFLTSLWAIQCVLIF